MSSKSNRKEGTTETRSAAPASRPEATRNRTMPFDCCGGRTDETGCPCAAAMRRHPFLAFVILALMGLAFLAIPTGIVLGIIAFLRTI